MEKILRTDTVVYLTGLSRVTLWRLERLSQFPKRRKLSARAVGWLESEIQAWIASRDHRGVSHVAAPVQSAEPMRAP
ncbi:MAG: helix-turn-helix transcriptional regulator [Candidatus Binataceae bacterium]